MDTRFLRHEEAEELLVNLLRDAGRPLTTREVQEETQKRLVRCPDTTAVMLNRLRIRGTIKGEMNREKKGWIWWV
jgi:hypothetical protein